METEYNGSSLREEPGLNRTMQYGNYIRLLDEVFKMCLFKSYYVVWKHGGNDLDICSQLRLNRTMQYGNEKMEYIIGEGTPSLNRTMQYGNFKQQHRKLFKIQFKSYYVVWKPAKNPRIIGTTLSV